MKEALLKKILSSIISDAEKTIDFLSNVIERDDKDTFLLCMELIPEKVKNLRVEGYGCLEYIAKNNAKEICQVCKEQLKFDFDHLADPLGIASAFASIETMEVILGELTSRILKQAEDRKRFDFQEILKAIQSDDLTGKKLNQYLLSLRFDDDEVENKKIKIYLLRYFCFLSARLGSIASMELLVEMADMRFDYKELTEKRYWQETQAVQQQWDPQALPVFKNVNDEEAQFLTSIQKFLQIDLESCFNIFGEIETALKNSFLAPSLKNKPFNVKAALNVNGAIWPVPENDFKRVKTFGWLDEYFRVYFKDKGIDEDIAPFNKIAIFAGSVDPEASDAYVKAGHSFGEAPVGIATCHSTYAHRFMLFLILKAIETGIIKTKLSAKAILELFLRNNTTENGDNFWINQLDQSFHFGNVFSFGSPHICNSWLLTQKRFPLLATYMQNHFFSQIKTAFDIYQTKTEAIQNIGFRQYATMYIIQTMCKHGSFDALPGDVTEKEIYSYYHARYVELKTVMYTSTDTGKVEQMPANVFFKPAKKQKEGFLKEFNERFGFLTLKNINVMPAAQEAVEKYIFAFGPKSQ